jgi:hypothetical protein
MTQSEINSLVGKRVSLKADVIAVPAGTLGIVLKVPSGQCMKPDFPLVRFDNGVERIMAPQSLSVTI